MSKLVFILLAGFFLSSCAEFAEVLGAKPQSNALAHNSTGTMNSSRVNRRVDKRIKEDAPLEQASEDSVTTDGAKSNNFIWPVEGGVVTSRYGLRKGRKHDGIDISAPRGTPVKASADGKVVYAGRLSGYGNLVIVKHGEDFFTAYAHAEQNKVSKGDQVKQGEVIATVGRSGRASGPHCHFEIRNKTQPRNPLYFLPKTETYAGN